MKKLIYLVLLLCCFSSIKAENYAILISAGQTTNDDVMYHSEFWYDLFVAYEDLILNEGYTHENIIVFYGNGTDFVSSHDRFNRALHGWIDPIVDFNNSENTIGSQISAISSTITNNDNVHIRWICGHGGSTTADNYSANIQNTGENISEQDLYDIFNQIGNYKRRKILWMTCHAGCIVHGTNNLNNDRTIVIPSSDWNESSYSLTEDGHPFAELNYVATSALFGETPNGTITDADANNDAEVSFQELFDFLEVSPDMRSNPQLGDNGFRANRNYLNEYISLSGANITGSISYETDNIVSSDYIVNGTGADVTFAASTIGSIKLQTGFKVNSGSKFIAFQGEIISNSLKSSEVESNDSESGTKDAELQFMIEEMDLNEMQPAISNISVYPNPTAGQLAIRVDNIDDLIQLSIYNISGQIVFTTQLSEHESNIDISNIQEGIYFIKLQGENGVTTKRIIKK